MTNAEVVTSNRRADVLVVDDNEEVAEAVRAILAQEFEVRAVLSVDAALEAIAVRTPALVLTDLAMPGRQGDELLSFISEKHPDVLRVVHSGITQADQQILLTARLAHAVLPKPCSGDRLRATIRNMIASHAKTAGATRASA